MKQGLIGLESSTIMPLVTVTPLTQDCYEVVWREYLSQTLVVHEDSLAELRNVFRFKADTFYSNPISRLEKIKEYSFCGGLSIKRAALKLLLDGQMGGWVGNKNSRVQAFFFSDVIDAVSDEVRDPKLFSTQLTAKMCEKVRTYDEMLTPRDGILTIDIRRILPYWGFHNVDPAILSESRTIQIRILPNCESSTMFESLPPGIRRDAYHYHMLTKERVHLLLVGDANFKNNVCPCQSCLSHGSEIRLLTGASRKKLLRLT